ncbi:MAG: hypothetical protein ACFFA4_15495 [Promethearchaeota archaeon]
MSVKEELTEEIMIYTDSKRVEDNNKKKVLGNLKRKYRLILIYLLCFSLILLLMILPVVIIALSQSLM